MPNTDASIVATLPNNSIVTVTERTTGEAVSGNIEWCESRAENSRPTDWGSQNLGSPGNGVRRPS